MSGPRRGGAPRPAPAVARPTVKAKGVGRHGWRGYCERCGQKAAACKCAPAQAAPSDT